MIILWIAVFLMIFGPFALMALDEARRTIQRILERK